MAAGFGLGNARLRWRESLWAMLAALFVWSGSGAWAAAQSETRLLPEFLQVTAIAARDEQGFGIVGTLRAGAPASQTGFLEVSGELKPLGKLSLLPAPDKDHPEVAAWSLLRMPEGDYVAAGWAFGTAGKPDGWVIRFTAEGEVIWNVILGSEWDTRLYSIRRLASGVLVAVGRTQQGGDAKFPSRGIIVRLDAQEGEVTARQEYRPSPDTLRCGLQDVAELADGGLVAVGWATRKDSADDVWVMRPLEDHAGNAKSLVWGDSGNDIGWATAPLERGFVLAGTLRKRQEQPGGILALFDGALARKSLYEAPRTALAGGQLRAIYPIPSTRSAFVAGETTRATPAGDQSAARGVYNTVAASAAMESMGATAGQSQVRAIAVDPAGTVAMAGGGTEGQNHALRGLLWSRRDGSPCQPDADKVAAISAALSRKAREPLLACARADQPAQFKLGAGQAGLGVVVRPLVGDIDAALVSKGDIAQASLNINRRAELLVLPEGGAAVELQVSTRSAYASFEIRLVPLNDPAARADDDGADEEGKTSLVPIALRALGYEHLGLFAPGENDQTFPDRRAVMAFQAGEGFNVTGSLSAKQLGRLYWQAARRIDPDARKRAEAARNAVVEAELTTLGTSSTLRSIAGALVDGHFVGRGEFSLGNELVATFEGEWTKAPDGGDRPNPRLGVMRMPNGCMLSVQLQTTQYPSFKDLMQGTLAVAWRGNQMMFAGTIGESASVDDTGNASAPCVH